MTPNPRGQQRSRRRSGARRGEPPPFSFSIGPKGGGATLGARTPCRFVSKHHADRCVIHPHQGESAMRLEAPGGVARAATWLGVDGQAVDQGREGLLDLIARGGPVAGVGDQQGGLADCSEE